jgi:Domain of unknown function (DUF5597)/Beta-galactosidase
MRFVPAVILISACLQAQTGSVPAQPPVPLPQIKQNGSVKQMFVDGKPYIMLAGELHNSSASSIEYMEAIWNRLDAMHLNTVIGTVNWELLEPDEGKFNFTLVDAQIQEAQKRNMRLVLIWFGSWKNGDSTYVPLWVKTKPQRFPVQRKKRRTKESGGMGDFFGGQRDLPLSPLGEASMLADAKAFRALLHHIKEVDPQHAVIMMQVENEMGLLGDSRDRSPLAEAAWTKPVPTELMNHLTKSKAILLPEMQEVWGRNGYKTSGTWAEVFGKDEWAEEVFMAWHYSRYLNNVISEGKAELDIPMYVNAWLGPQPGEELPGDWPSGGPVARVMDVWRAGAPSVDLVAPDIYAQDFKGVCTLYTRSGNPLFIPEARDQVGNLFWAFGQHSAMGWSVFGVEDLGVDGQVSKAYSMFGEMLPQLAEWQAEGKVAGVLLLDGKENQVVSLGGYKVTAARAGMHGPGGPAPEATAAGPATAAPAPMLAGGISSHSRSLAGDTRPFGLVINTEPNKFLLIGSNLSASFAPDSPGPSRVAVGTIDEGHYVKGLWVPGRRLNGDEGHPNLGSGNIGG